ncbi:hypothetical protein PVAP13_9KG071220 [Panicum virgatum]|uniref:Uncharacterized protein n=1 Tax=Panicum virgatum TaxID=38727 RepID=A0A8T0NJE4_PANVG|nr:hypothetical protein PVAP13_9KG071220 [Panicum virgatum]
MTADAPGPQLVEPDPHLVEPDQRRRLLPPAAAALAPPFLRQLRPRVVARRRRRKGESDRAESARPLLERIGRRQDSMASAGRCGAGSSSSRRGGRNAGLAASAFGLGRRFRWGPRMADGCGGDKPTGRGGDGGEAIGEQRSGEGLRLLPRVLPAVGRARRRRRGRGAIRAPPRRPASPPAPTAAAPLPAPRPLPLQRAPVRRRPRHRRRPLSLPILVRATAGPRVLVEVVAALGPRAPPAVSARYLARRRPPGPRRAPAEAAALDEDRVHLLLGIARRAHRRRGHHHHGAAAARPPPAAPAIPAASSSPPLPPQSPWPSRRAPRPYLRRPAPPPAWPSSNHGRELWRKRRRKPGGRRCFVDAAEGSFVDHLGTARGGRRPAGHTYNGWVRASQGQNRPFAARSLSQMTENIKIMAAVCSGKITAIHNGTRPINELAVSSGKLRKSSVSRSKFSHNNNTTRTVTHLQAAAAGGSRK